MVFLLFIFLFPFVLPSSHAADSEIIEVLPPIIIERPAPPPIFKDLPLTVQVPSGSGTRLIDPGRNELGIEQTTMERFPDLSLDRRQTPWLLPFPRAHPQVRERWTVLSHTELTLDPIARLRLHRGGHSLGFSTELEVGLHQDHRRVPFFENRSNPFDPSQSTKSSFPNQMESYFARALLRSKKWSFLSDWDYRQSQTRAASLLTGNQSEHQGSLNGQFTTDLARVQTFVQARQAEFHSELSPLQTNWSKGFKVGAQTRLSFLEDLFTLEDTVSFERLNRRYADQSARQFSRVHLKNVAQFTPEIANWIEVETHLSIELAKDEVFNPEYSARISPIVWDTGLALSSSTQEIAGLEAKGRRYSFLPTPSQTFGDGVLLQGNTDLPNENGTRVSAGPWFKFRNTEAHLSVFQEQARNSPLMFAVSPAAARTMPLGGLWANGFTLEFMQHWENLGGHLGQRLELAIHCTFQRVLNDSQVVYERGNPVPGRPDKTLSARIGYRSRKWKFGSLYAYRSQEAMDLTHLWFKPPDHQLEAYLGYGTLDWEVRLEAKKLLASKNLPQAAQFAGTAAPNLLQPRLEQTEVRLICEFLI